MRKIDDIALGNKNIFLKEFEKIKTQIKDIPDMLYLDWWKIMKYYELKQDSVSEGFIICYCINDYGFNGNDFSIASNISAT